MGAGQSGGVEIGGSPMGYQVLRVYPKSPGSQAGLKAYFDFIVAIGNSRFDKENGSLREILKASVDQKLKMVVYNTRSKIVREVEIIPSTSWGGSGLLGVSIKHCSFDRADERVWHVIEVDSGSPAQQAGFRAKEDYVIGSDSILQENDDLYNLIESHEGKALKLFVYNTETDNCREIICYPNSKWGGRGYLGCEFGHGLLHRIPLNDNQNGVKSPSTQDGDTTPLLSSVAPLATSAHQQPNVQPNPYTLASQKTAPPTISQQPTRPPLQTPSQPGYQMFQQVLFDNKPPSQQQQQPANVTEQMPSQQQQQQLQQQQPQVPQTFAQLANAQFLQSNQQYQPPNKHQSPPQSPPLQPAQQSQFVQQQPQNQMPNFIQQQQRQSPPSDGPPLSPPMNQQQQPQAQKSLSNANHSPYQQPLLQQQQQNRPPFDQQADQSLANNLQQAQHVHQPSAHNFQAGPPPSGSDQQAPHLHQPSFPQLFQQPPQLTSFEDQSSQGPGPFDMGQQNPTMQFAHQVPPHPSSQSGPMYPPPMQPQALPLLSPAAGQHNHQQPSPPTNHPQQHLQHHNEQSQQLGHQQMVPSPPPVATPPFGLAQQQQQQQN